MHGSKQYGFLEGFKKHKFAQMTLVSVALLGVEKDI